jgi:MFS family permease
MGLDKEQATTTFTIANNVVNVIATFPGMYLIERMGRRRLLIIGGLFMGLAHYAVCLFVTLGNNAVQDLPLNQKSSPFFYLAIASVYAFIIGFASTWGPITWVYQSEVFPQRVRGKGTGISTFSNWAGNAIVALITPIITENVKEKMYLIFGSACIIMAVFTFGFIPETMGKSLEDMDELFGSSNQSRIESGNKK